MKISNFISLQIANRLNQSTQAINQSIRRLETGRRVLRPNDDIGAFSIANRLESQVRGLDQVILGINRMIGSSLSAQVGVSEQIELVKQMRDLASDAKSSSLTSSERQELNQNLAALLESYQEVVNTTEFSRTKLLDGSRDGLSYLTNEKGQMASLPLFSTTASDQFKLSMPTGEFTTVGALPSFSSDPRDTRLVDVTGDGNKDLIYRDSTSSLVVSIGNGQGGFLNTTKFDDDTVISFDSGDMTGNGHTDLVRFSTGGVVSILEGDGTGSFNFASSFSTGETATDIKVGDLTGNGHFDILTSTGSAEILLYENDGTGSFSSPSTISTGGVVGERLQIADLNGNGKLDIVVFDPYDDEIAVLHGDGTGVFSVEQSFSPAGDRHMLRDLNGNGVLDLIVLDTGSGTRVYQGDGSGTFSTSPINTGIAFISQIDFIDYNRNGRLDLVGAVGGARFIALNDANGGFDTSNLIIFDNSGSNSGFAVGDIDGDGFSEFLTIDSGNARFNLLKMERKLMSAAGQLNLLNQSSAEKSFEVFDRAVESLEIIERRLGSQIDLLESKDQQVTDRQLLSAEIRNNLIAVDEARENAKLVQNQILQEAQVAALTQANIGMQIVLDLLNPGRRSEEGFA